MVVTGIGGIFFRAKDPEALLKWYRTHLGIAVEGQMHWNQQAGPTVFMPFAHDTDYWPGNKQWMMNFRVTDLDTLLASLRLAGVAVETDPNWDAPEIGRFARIHDPEGNPLELWEPAEGAG
ncbi:VOC family protein [Sphingomonas sp. TX0543]|uniref:VOC family protein n=1 Tax=unclassified Sphingomonas TaxID=196159 RepID=UPI0010F550BC|nr:VOC family protein [Sphingomonas sp. 3P27F8]